MPCGIRRSHIKIGGVKMVWGFGKKKKHADFPNMPMGVRLGGLAQFKASAVTQFLLNASKMGVNIPSDEKVVINAVSSFSLYGLNIYRAYLNSISPKSVIQFHCDENGNVKDVILFNEVYNASLLFDLKLKKEWRGLIGSYDMDTPQGFSYTRDWMADKENFGDKVDPVTFTENVFKDEENLIWNYHSCMLYSRIIEGGTDEDIEYLLTSIIKNESQEYVSALVGTVMAAGSVEFF